MTNNNKNDQGASGDKEDSKAGKDESREVDDDETVTVSTLNLKALESELWSDDEESEDQGPTEADDDQADAT